MKSFKSSLVAAAILLSFSAGAVVIQGETSPGVYTNVAVNGSGVLSSSATITYPAQGATTSGQTGGMVQGATTTAAPTYTNGTINPLNLTTSGALRVDGSGTTQPVSGTITAVTSITNALPAGTNNIGKVTATVPNATTVTNVSLQTNATGTTYNAFASNTCNGLDIVNNTGTTVEYRRGAAGVAIPIKDGASRLVIGITNANAIDLRRTDTSNTQVTVQAECIVN